MGLQGLVVESADLIISSLTALSHRGERQVLLLEGHVVFLRVFRFAPNFDKRSARYKRNILEKAVTLPTPPPPPPPPRQENIQV